MNADEMVRQVAEKYANTGCQYAGQSVVRMAIEAAVREMYSLARAETAKEVIEVAANCVVGDWVNAPESQRRIRALASRYAETPKGGVA